MKILFLGYKNCKLGEFLSKTHEVTQTQSKIDINFAKKFQFIISFGYKHIITNDIIDIFGKNIVNLHISYLPYNRGYYPNFWSFVDNTPKGVTIHLVDDGIDTGDILIQREVEFTKEEDTLSKTYTRLIDEIQNLFIENVDMIISGQIRPTKQIKGGKLNYKNDLEDYIDILNEGWDTKTNKLWKRKEQT